MTRPARQIDDTLGALADPVRRRVVEVLSEGPRRPGELAEMTGVSAPTVSKHLRVLRTAGLVSEEHPEHDARVRIYTLRSAPMKELRAWLEAAERGWTQQLSSFARFVEEEKR